LSKPKSTRVNPTRPKRSVLSLQRLKRSLYSYNPQIKELKLLAKKLNDCGSGENEYVSVLETFPYPPTRENALLIRNSLRPWQKTIFSSIGSRPVFISYETIFYNVTTKSVLTFKNVIIVIF